MLYTTLFTRTHGGAKHAPLHATATAAAAAPACVMAHHSQNQPGALLMTLPVRSLHATHTSASFPGLSKAHLLVPRNPSHSLSLSHHTMQLHLTCNR